MALISIGKDAARNRLARELVEEVLAECIVCEQMFATQFGGAEYHLHKPAAECAGCNAPHEHHEYKPRGGKQ